MQTTRKSKQTHDSELVADTEETVSSSGDVPTVIAYKCQAEKEDNNKYRLIELLSCVLLLVLLASMWSAMWIDDHEVYCLVLT